uniref:Glycolipid transfer protein domain-containing protein n=1 Tax=Panagrolaimus sp. PS1159 TaxID=55785 RepID=A0AC35G2L5_9BILA
MSADSFQIESVIKHFEECLHEENDIDLMTYVRAYEELSRLFNILGIIFSFVESDVKEKREILKQLYQQDSQSYKSVNSMVEYEIVPGQKPKQIGCRTLLRLHRALEFLILFVEDVHRSKPEDNISELFRDAYEKSLSQHHGWLIRKTVQLASHAVPSRDFLIKVIFAHGEEPTPEQLESVACKFVKVVQDVYDRVQLIYADNKLLNLP